MPELATLPPLTAEDLQRYHRHLILPEVGPEGQQRVRAASVLLVGAGGLGSPAALYLAAAGIGTLGLVDADEVDASNLQRQVLYATADVGRPKVEAASAHLHALNPGVRVVAHETRLTAANALEILAPYDIIVDGSDNFPTRYLVNDACVLLGKPDIYGSIYRFEGQAAVFDARRGPCYRCLYPEPPPPGAVPNCMEAGVLGVLPGLVGVIQAVEVLKLVLGAGEPLIGRLLLVDALSMRFRDLKLRKSPSCPACSAHPTPTALIDYDHFCGVTGDDAGAADPEAHLEVSPTQLKAELDNGATVRMIDVRETFEFAHVRIDGAENIPLGTIPGFAQADAERDRDIVVYCHHGIRSAQAQAFLLQQGFTRVRNLSGGIDRWASDVDPAMLRY